jgi:hypothetical protein
MTMHASLSGRCDRRGHGAVWALILLFVLLSPRSAAAAGAGKYKAQRFDVNARVVEGSLDVEETIVFEFQTGVFKKVWRDIPASRTDGIEILEARMDGVAMPRGDGPGHIIVSGRNRVRVEWQFAEVGASVHTFELRYLARGVAYSENDRDVVRWRLLPGEHRYRIDATRATIGAPEALLGPPVVESRKTSELKTAWDGKVSTLTTGAVGENGWTTAELSYPRGSLVSSAPAWQAQHSVAAALAPRWAMAAAALFIGGVLLVLLVRQGYESPGFDTGPQATSTEPPEALPVAMAASLAAKGRGIGYQSVATLLDLADRGVVTVRELPRRFGARQYELAQVPGKHDLTHHEIEALTLAFAGSGDEVTMSRARARLARGGRRFSKALNEDLEERGLIDLSRQAVRRRLTVVSIAMLFAGGIACIGVAPLIPRYDGWPFLLPLALAVSGLVGVVMAAATTPLSDAGLMQSARWRGFKRYLKDVAEARDVSGPSTVRPRWVVYGIGLGLAHQWSRYLKKHPAAAPPWFVADVSEDGGSAFATFVGSSATAAGGGGHGGGGGAAGGGGSGAG